MAWTEGDGPRDQTEWVPPAANVAPPGHKVPEHDQGASWFQQREPERPRTDWGDVIESAAAALVVVVFVVTLCLMWLHKQGVI